MEGEKGGGKMYPFVSVCATSHLRINYGGGLVAGQMLCTISLSNFSLHWFRCQPSSFVRAATPSVCDRLPFESERQFSSYLLLPLLR